MRRFIIALFAVAMLSQNGVSQQKNQVAIMFGRTFISHQTVQGTNFVGNSVAFGAGPSIEADYSRLVKPGDLVSVSLEVPVLLNLDEDLNYGLNSVPMDLTSYFVTPSARFTFFPNLPVTPWASVGAGFGRFSESSNLEFGGPNPGKGGSTTGVVQFGVGLDVALWRSFSARGEARDYYSGVPQLNVNTGKSRENNLFVGIGLVWHFGH